MDGKIVYSERVQDHGALCDILNVIFPDVEDFQRWVVMRHCVIMMCTYPWHDIQLTGRKAYLSTWFVEFWWKTLKNAVAAL